MVCGTSDFDAWLEALRTTVANQAIEPALIAIAQRLDDDFAAHVWFAQVHGPRWAHIAGDIAAVPGSGPLERIPLGDHLGLVVASWGSLTDHNQAQLIAFLRQLAQTR